MTPSVTLAVVIGAATAPGRLHAAATQMAVDAAERLEVVVVDLSTSPLDLADGRPLEQCNQPTRNAVYGIDRADAVIISTPVYRASYPGALKNLLDLLPLSALQGKPVGVVAMGATLHHYLAVDSQLRGVLAWFGAFALPTGLYLTGADFDAGGKPTESAREELGALWRGTADVADRLRGAALGPSPLAARGR